MRMLMPMLMPMLMLMIMVVVVVVPMVMIVLMVMVMVVAVVVVVVMACLATAGTHLNKELVIETIAARPQYADANTYSTHLISHPHHAIVGERDCWGAFRGSVLEPYRHRGGHKAVDEAGAHG